MALNISPADNNRRRNAAIRVSRLLPGFISRTTGSLRIKDRASKRANASTSIPFFPPPVVPFASLPMNLRYASPMQQLALPRQIRLACESRDPEWDSLTRRQLNASRDFKLPSLIWILDRWFWKIWTSKRRNLIHVIFVKFIDGKIFVIVAW